jgi:hypothetical protein
MVSFCELFQKKKNRLVFGMSRKGVEKIVANLLVLKIGTGLTDRTILHFKDRTIPSMSVPFSFFISLHIR